MSDGSDTRLMVAELRLQGWVVELTSTGQKYRAVPPDARAETIYFATKLDQNGFLTATRHLRAQGFQWPPPPVEKRPPEPSHTSTPFAAKPHPSVETLRLVGRARGGEGTVAIDGAAAKNQYTGNGFYPSTSVPDRAAPKSPEDAFAALREAKEFERLCGEETAKASATLRAAAQASDKARKDHEEAIAALKKARQAFDMAFEPEAS
jgi:hypothetical protein